jgi:putative salt-induced outer membrane protein
VKTNYKSINTLLSLATIAVLAMNNGPASAQTPAPVEPEKKKVWDGSANAGLTLTSGNSDTLLATIGANARRRWEQSELRLGASGGYGESDDVKNAEFATGFAQYNWLFTERFFAGFRVDGTYDGIANLSYRVNIAPLVGYNFIKNDKTLLSVEAGPSLVIVKYFGEADNDSYLGMRFGQRFEHRLTETTRIWEYADYTPQVDRWADNYVVNIEVGISTSINKSWSLRVVGQYIYDNEPAVGRQKDDLRLLAGTEYKF